MGIGKTNAITIIGGGGGQDAVLREYTSSATWTKPAGLKYLYIVIIGGGGGGCSGTRSTSSVLFGGSGGLGGDIKEVFLAENMVSSGNIIIGSGGQGGAGSTSLASRNNGASGGDSSFLGIVAKGGVGGSQTTGSVAYNSLNGMFAPSGGNGGGKVSAVPDAGFSGGSLYLNNGTLQNPASGGVASGGDGGDGVDNIIKIYTSLNGIGTGGGGGGGSISSIGGNGGDGGLYGAGGGGGGSNSSTYTPTGAGGNGAGGLCIVLEIY